jgi:hypothetical protein
LEKRRPKLWDIGKIVTYTDMMKTSAKNAAHLIIIGKPIFALIVDIKRLGTGL